MKQYLTRPDGTLPANVDPARLAAEGITIVRPSPRHRPAEGMTLVEGAPEQREGVWWQTWREVPAPAPESVEDVTPVEVSLWRFRAALRLAGLFDRVETLVRDMRDDARGVVVAEAWEYGNTISRTSPLVQQLATRIGISDKQLDEIFRSAAGIGA